jgi:hypothetical protein
LPTYVPIAPGLRLPVRNPQTDALPDRIVLVPSDGDVKAAVATGVGVEKRSEGLLSKYRETQQ